MKTLWEFRNGTLFLNNNRVTYYDIGRGFVLLHTGPFKPRNRECIRVSGLWVQLKFPKVFQEQADKG